MHNYANYEATVVAYDEYVKRCLCGGALSFSEWCNLSTEDTDYRLTISNIVSWIKPGQWFKLQNIQLFDSDTDFVRVQHISINGMHFTNGYRLSIEAYYNVMTSKIQRQRFVPVSIKPWSLEDARVAMLSGVGIHICNNTHTDDFHMNTEHTITDVRLSINAQYPQLSFTNGKSYYTDILAKIAETEHFEPCGEPYTPSIIEV